MFSINLYLAIALLIFFFVIYPLIIMFLLRDNFNVLKIVSIISFALYLILLATLVFGDVSTKNNMFNVKLFADANWFSMDFCWASFNYKNILYNIIMMFPISAFVLVITKSIVLQYNQFVKVQKKVFLLTILLAFCISFLIELFQFILPVSRTTEVLDLIINTFSGVLGYAFFAFLILIYKKGQSKKQTAKKQ